MLILNDEKYGLVAVRISKVSGKDDKNVYTKYTHIIKDRLACGLELESYLKGDTVRRINHIKGIYTRNKMMGKFDLDKCREKYNAFMQDKFVILDEFMEWLKFKNLSEKTGDLSKIRLMKFETFISSNSTTMFDVASAVRYICKTYNIDHRLGMAWYEDGKVIPIIVTSEDEGAGKRAFMYIPSRPGTYCKGDFGKFKVDKIEDLLTPAAATIHNRMGNRGKFTAKPLNNYQEAFWDKCVDGGNDIDFLIKNIKFKETNHSFRENNEVRWNKHVL